MKMKHFAGIVFLLVLGIGLRWLAAREAYPTPGDGGHFVQYGVAMAHGHAKLNTYWSQAMVAAAAGAELAGFDPRRVLQGISFVSGIFVVLLFAGICTRITHSRWWGLAGGLWAATNPTMVQYSIEGYSEMGYMMFLMGAVYVGVGGEASWKRDVVTGVLLGIGGYFKGLDAAVAAVAYGAWRLWWGGRKRWDWAMAPVVPVVAFAVLLPLCVYTFSETGQFAPGSKGSGNFLLGPDWKDSKVVYAADGVKTRSYGETLQALPRQVMENVHDAFRLINGQLFTRGLRMGTICFALLAILLAKGVVKQPSKLDEGKVMCVVCLAGLQLGVMSLAFVHARILAPTLPWVALWAILGIRGWSMGWDKGAQIIGGFTLGLYFAVCGTYAIQVWQTEFGWWRHARVSQVAEEIKAMGMGEEDVVMHYGPQLAIETHKENPLLSAEVPYGSLEAVAQVAREKRVRFAAISDTWRGHWPIAQIVKEEGKSPQGWVLRKELVFPEEEEGNYPSERIRIYEVLPPENQS